MGGSTAIGRQPSFKRGRIIAIILYFIYQKLRSYTVNFKYTCSAHRVYAKFSNLLLQFLMGESSHKNIKTV